MTCSFSLSSARSVLLQDGLTALSLLSHQGRTELVQLLLKHGAVVDLQNDVRKFAYMYMSFMASSSQFILFPDPKVGLISVYTTKLSQIMPHIV